MNTTRRDFLRYCGVSAAALGLTATDLFHLGEALANPNGPSVLWLQGASCTGCSVSLLNRISPTAPTTAGDLLINSINLVYHPQLMTAAGAAAVDAVETAYARGGYVLAVEGGVPTAFGGAAGWAMSDASGRDVTIADAVKKYAARAAAVMCVGTCASFGGIPASGGNPTGIKSVSAHTGIRTINIAGCPAHPDWIVWPITQLMLGNSIVVDGSGRPKALYDRPIHSVCPYKGTEEAKSFGQTNSRCLKELGCRGPETYSQCSSTKWNNGVNWCIGAGSPCIGCTQPSFPGTRAFKKIER